MPPEFGVGRFPLSTALYWLQHHAEAPRQTEGGTPDGALVDADPPAPSEAPVPPGANPQLPLPDRSRGGQERGVRASPDRGVPGGAAGNRREGSCRRRRSVSVRGAIPRSLRGRSLVRESRAARDAEYEDLARSLVGAEDPAALARARRRFEKIARIDFFGSEGRARAESMLASAGRRAGAAAPARGTRSRPGKAGRGPRGGDSTSTGSPAPG